MWQVALLTDFKDYLPPEVLLKGGGSAVLEPELKQILEPAIERAQQCEGIRYPLCTLNRVQGCGVLSRLRLVDLDLLEV